MDFLASLLTLPTSCSRLHDGQHLQFSIDVRASLLTLPVHAGTSPNPAVAWLTVCIFSCRRMSLLICSLYASMQQATQQAACSMAAAGGASFQWMSLLLCSLYAIMQHARQQAACSMQVAGGMQQARQRAACSRQGGKRHVVPCSTLEVPCSTL